MPEAPEAVRAPIGASAGDILRWVLVSAGAAAFITTMLLALLAEGQARSALLGGGIAFIANGYSVWRVFSAPTDVSGAMMLAKIRGRFPTEWLECLRHRTQQKRKD